MADVAVKPANAELLESVVIGGDLSKLTAADRLVYYRQVCESVGLNPLTRPFDYLTLNGRMVLYAKRDATDQLRKIHRVSISKLETSTLGDIYLVVAYARDAEGRTDSALGAVNIANLRGEALANALMKAETKAKRRVTLSLCGLGLLDESEVEGALASEATETERNGAATIALETSLPAPVEDKGEAIISDPQIKRLSAIATGQKWTDDQLHDLLAGYQYSSRKEVRVKDYDAIVEQIKAGPRR